MHILQLVPSLNVGGVERGVIDISKGLIARGHQVSVISSGGSLVNALQATGARHYALPVHKKSLASILACIPKVTRIIQEHNVDIVHARSRVPGWIAWAAARKTQRVFITTAHGFYSPSLASRVMLWGRQVIAPSEALAAYLVQQFKLPKQRLRVIARGLDLDTFALQPLRTQDGCWRIGLFGRLSSIKGHAIALQACARLVAQGHQVQLRIAGDQDGALKQSLQRMAHELNISACVEWLGVRHDIPQLIASVDAVIVPSTYPESFGRGVIEAQAVGRPVVASRIGALTQLIEPEQTGLLVTPKDPASLAQAIERFLHDDTLVQRCVRQGRVHVEAQWSLDRMVDQTLQVYEASLHKPRVVLWKLSALGDVILAVPGIRAVRKQLPQAYITLIIGRSFYEVLAHCPYVDNIVIYDAKGKDRGFTGRWRLAQRLRQEAFDISIDFQNSRLTHGLAWLTGARVRVGFKRKWGILLNRAVALPKQAMAPVKHQFYLLKHAGFQAQDEHLELWPTPQDEQAAQQLLHTGKQQQAAKGLIAIHPGGSGRWRTKRWDLNRWAQLADRLIEQGMRVVIVGGPDEQHLGAELTRLMQHAPLIVIGQTRILQLACLIQHCDLFMGHDSSTLHLAAAMHTPAVALFGPTDPARHLPPAFFGNVLQQKVFCAPCYSPYCRTLKHACMQRIEVDAVFESAQKLLDTP